MIPSMPSVRCSRATQTPALASAIVGVRARSCQPSPRRATLIRRRAVPPGARWDIQTGVIAEARLKELTPAMPVIFIKAIPVCPQKKFLMSGVTIFTQSFTCRLGCSKVAEDTTADRR